jgi:hypothetical protein
VSKFRETGSIADAPRSGQPTLLTDDKLDEMLDRMLRSPSKCIRRLSQETNVAASTVHKAIREKLKLYPYRMSALHELEPTDNAKRLQYCDWFDTFTQEKRRRCSDVTFYTDEAWFHLSSCVNSQNSRLWSSENPLALHESPLHA